MEAWNRKVADQAAVVQREEAEKALRVSRGFPGEVANHRDVDGVTPPVAGLRPKDSPDIIALGDST